MHRGENGFGEDLEKNGRQKRNGGTRLIWRKSDADALELEPLCGRLCDDIWQSHSQIHIVDFYSIDVLNRCENGNVFCISPNPSETIKNFFQHFKRYCSRVMSRHNDVIT